MRSAFVLLLLSHVAAAAPRKIEVTADEAKQHKLSHRIAIDITDTALTPNKFTAPDVYLTLSGPPGGPLGMQILDQPRKLLDDDTLQRHVMASYNVTAVTKVATVRLAGRTWRGVAFIQGASLARSINVYLVDSKGLAIHLDIGSAVKALADSDVTTTLAAKPFATILPTLSID